MISQFELSFRAWYPDGRSISGEQLVSALGVDASAFSVLGSGQQWEAARIVDLEHSLETHEADEPHEVFATAIHDSFIRFGKWLSRLSSDSCDVLRSKGIILDVFVNLLIDQNQFDIEFPSEFISEIGRMQLSLKIVSND
jgi:hypothetical protein